MPRITEFQIYGKFGDRTLERDFRLQCDSVAGLYERSFRSDIQMASASKITVYVQENRTLDHLHEILTRLHVEVVDDNSCFFSLSDRAKQESALKWLHAACLEGAERFCWPRAPFEAARARVIDANFVNEWIHRHKAIRQDRRLRAELRCVHGIHEFRSEVVVFGKSNTELARFPDLTTLPDRMIFGWELGKMRWVSDTCVEIRDIHGSEPRAVDVSDVTQ